MSMLGGIVLGCRCFLNGLCFICMFSPLVCILGRFVLPNGSPITDISFILLSFGVQIILYLSHALLFFSIIRLTVFLLQSFILFIQFLFLVMRVRGKDIVKESA